MLPGVVILLTAGFVFRGHTAFLDNLPSATVQLPIEVIGAEGTVESRTLQLSDPAGVDSMYIRGMRLGYAYTAYLADNPHLYDTKASFRINGGDWVDISNDTFHAFYPERKFYSWPLTGPISGSWHVLRGMLPITDTGALVAGENTVEFRFNGPLDKETSGYYIVELDFRPSRDGSSIVTSTFTEVDYASWGPPSGYNNSSDINAGDALWSSRNSLWDNPVDQNTIVAACQDCHATDGRDLKQFNFSNNSVITRAQFHGLTESEGKQIAAYIRTRDLEYPTGYDLNNCGGRPWNPPYQTGPGVDQLPGECWSAGAGAKWVLDNDIDGLPYMFPDEASRLTLEGLTEIPEDPEALEAIHGGPLQADLSAANLDRFIHADSTINHPRQPWSAQFPVIHEWWPRIYPADVLGDAEFHSSSPYQQFLSTRTAFQNNRSTILNNTRNRTTNDIPENMFNPISTGLIQDAPHSLNPSIAQYSANQWNVIKKWEIMNTYHLEDLGEDLYGEGQSAQQPRGGSRLTWHASGNHLYDAAPHKNQRPPGPGYPRIGPYPTASTASYFSTTWYQLSQMLEDNNRNGDGGANPFDWNYHHPHITGPSGDFNHPESLRYLHAQVQSQQQHRNYAGWDARISFRNKSGWKSLHNHWVGRIKWNNATETLSPLTQATQNAINAAILRAWISESLRWDPAQYWNEHRFASTGDQRIAPVMETFSLSGGSSVGINANKGNELFNLLNILQQDGVDAASIDNAAYFGSRLWPLSNWDQFRQGTPTRPSVALAGVTAGDVISPGTQVTLDASPSAGVNRVDFYRGREHLATVTSSPWTHDTDIDEGFNNFMAVAYDSDGEAGGSEPTAVVGAGSNLPEPWADLDLGTVDISGSTTFNSGEFVISNSGERWANGDNDSPRFVFQPLWGDFEITARVTAQSASNGGAAAGVMVRDGASSADFFQAITVEKQGQLAHLRRNSANISGKRNIVDNSQGVPVWLRLERAGDIIKGYSSTDGTNWTEQFSEGVADHELTDELLWVGMGGHASRRYQLADHTFDNVTVVGGEQTASPVSVSMTKPVSGAEFAAPATIQLEASVSLGEDETVEVVEFLVDGEVMHETSQAPYTVTWEDVGEGTYELSARATTESGATATSTPATVTVGDTASDPQQQLVLQPGWNHIARYIQPADRAMESILAPVLEAVVMVKNIDGQVYIPEIDGLDDIGTWADDESYMVFTGDAVTFTIEGEMPSLEERAVSLQEGWNYAPYRGTALLDAAVALEALSNLVIATDLSGGVYFPAFDINTLGAMEPGTGYRIFMSDVDTWTLPAEADTDTLLQAQQQAPLTPEPAAASSPPSGFIQQTSLPQQ